MPICHGLLSKSWSLLSKSWGMFAIVVGDEEHLP
jgi:hypothetical protein